MKDRVDKLRTEIRILESIARDQSREMELTLQTANVLLGDILEMIAEIDAKKEGPCPKQIPNTNSRNFNS